MLTPAPCPPTRSDSVPRTPLNRSISTRKARHRQRWSTPPSANIRPVQLIANSVPVDHIILEEDFRLRAEAYMAFLLELSDTTTREAISRFQVQITNVVKHMDHV